MPLIKDTRKKRKKGYYTDSKVYDELEAITGIGRKTIQEHKWVAENVDSSLRQEDISFSHHREVAKLSPEKQKNNIGTLKSETAFDS